MRPSQRKKFGMWPSAHKRLPTPELYSVLNLFLSCFIIFWSWKSIKYIKLSINNIFHYCKIKCKQITNTCDRKQNFKNLADEYNLFRSLKFHNCLNFIVTSHKSPCYFKCRVTTYDLTMYVFGPCSQQVAGRPFRFGINLDMIRRRTVETRKPAVFPHGRWC